MRTMLHHSILVVVALVVSMVQLRNAEADEATIGMCYATDKRVECGAAATPEAVESYVRSQCNFWRDAKSPKCREVLTCGERGWFIVRHANTADSLVARCGVGKQSRKDAEGWLEMNCRTADCKTEAWWIGPRETDEERAAAERKREEEAAARQREADEKKRLEDEKKKREEEQKQREEEARKRQEDERKRQEEAKKRQADATQRQADERTKSDERRRQLAEDQARQRQLAEQERQRKIAQGFSDLQAAQDANNKMGQSSAAVAATVFAVEGGNAGTLATTRALRVGFGFGGKFLPHMSNTTGSDVVEESTQTTGGGFAFDGSLEFWPLYRKQFGVAIAGEGGVAGMALPGGGMYALDAGLGVKGYYGDRTRWTIRGELDLAARLVGSAANLIGAINSGSGSYSLWRLGAGPSFCKTASLTGFCETAFYAMLLLDWTTIPPGGTRADMSGLPMADGRRTGTLVRLGAMSKYAPYGMGLELELGFGYPAPGETRFPIQPGDEDRAGLYFGFAMRKAWTWHSGNAKR